MADISFGTKGEYFFENKSTGFFVKSNNRRQPHSYQDRDKGRFINTHSSKVGGIKLFFIDNDI
jgi:hypothetical protein